MMLMTPPIAMLPYRLDDESSVISTRSTLAERHARPVDPAAERIVERDAVEQDERAALAARTDAAQRHALRRRLRDEAAGAPEQAEASAPAAARRRRSAPATPRSASLVTTLTLAGTSPSRCSVRVGVTVTVSSSVAGCDA